MSCEICGGRADELARTRKYIWLGCHDCHRTWRDDIRGAVPVLGAGATSREPQHFARAVSIIRGCLLTVGAVALAFGLRSVLRPAIGNASPFLVFTPAVMVTAFYAGPAAGVFATISSALLGSHFFLRTLGEPSIEKWDRVALFLLVGALITILSAVVSKARERLHASLWREQTARAEAEAASQAKDEFLALVSHELQTPASVVLGWASMIRARQLTGQPLVHALDVIERNARMQSKLVEDVLDTSRIVNGTMRLERQRVSLTTIVAAAVEQMRPAIEGHQLQLDLQRASDDWAVLADAVRLQQVFTNLLSNAVKFTPAGGCVSIAMTRTDNVATVTVSDNGVGIASAFLPRMFERFEQDSQTLAFSRQGLGLGLSICRHFVEQHGGTITASSEGPGKGAAFAVSLPLDLRELPTSVLARRYSPMRSGRFPYCLSKTMTTRGLCWRACSSGTGLASTRLVRPRKHAPCWASRRAMSCFVICGCPAMMAWRSSERSVARSIGDWPRFLLPRSPRRACPRIISGRWPPDIRSIFGSRSSPMIWRWRSRRSRGRGRTRDALSTRDAHVRGCPVSFLMKSCSHGMGTVAPSGIWSAEARDVEVA